MADFLEDGGCALEECVRFGKHVFGLAHHVHYFLRQLLEERVNARGYI